MREPLRRALAYPYAAPQGSFLQVGGRALELTDADLDLSGRLPLLAYGSNAAPEALTRKLAAEPTTPLPLIRAELDDFDAVYSAHLSAYGSVPATLRPSPGTAVHVFVAYPTERQLALIGATEPNYALTRLSAISCRLDGGALLTAADAFLSRHGSLSLDGAELALAAIGARGRGLREMSQPQVLELVRSSLFPDLDLERFVARRIESGGLAPLPELTSL
jgi:hypothetical protein